MMTGTKFDIEKFDGKNDFMLWQVRMKALLEQQFYRRSPKRRLQRGFEKKLETLYMIKSLANRLYLKKKLYTFHMHPGKSQSEHIDEFHKLVGDLAAIDAAISDKDHALLLLTSLPSSYNNFVETLLYDQDTIKLEDVVATLNSRELQKMTEAKGDGGEGFYVSGRSGQRDMEQGFRLWSYGYDNVDVMMAMSVEELLDWIMDSGGSYHITYMRDSLVDLKEYDGGNILFGDSKKCRVWGDMYVPELRRNLISLGTLEKEGFTVKMQSGKIKVKKGSLMRSTQQCMKSGVAKYLGVAGIQQQNGLVNETNMTLFAKVRCFLIQSGLSKIFWAEDTTMSTYLVNRSPSSATGFKTHIDMLGFFGWLASIKQGMLEPVKVKCIFLRYRKGTGSMQLLQGVEFEVESQEDHTFEVEPHRNVNHVDAWELFSYREDSNEAAFAVAEAEKIYAHESLTFNNTVACEVISKWKAGLKDDMDARSDVYVLSNGCRKYSDDSDVYYWEYTLAKRNILGMEIFRDQSGNTLRVSQSRFYNRKLVQTLLEGHSILSLEGSLSRDCDVEKNGKWSCIYAVGSQEYQMVCTRLDITSADVGMLDKFDHGLQTDVHVFVDFDYAMGRSITSGVYDTYGGCKGGYWAKGTCNRVMIQAKDSSGYCYWCLVKGYPWSELSDCLSIIGNEETLRRRNVQSLSLMNPTTKQSLIKFQVGKSTSKQRNEKTMLKSLAKGILNDTSAKKRPTSILAKLMGRDGLYSARPIHKQEIRLSDKSSKMITMEQQNVYEDLEASHLANQSHSLQPCTRMRKHINEMMTVQEDGDELISGSNKTESNRHMNDSNSDLMLDLLPKPDPLFVKHLHDQKFQKEAEETRAFQDPLAHLSIKSSRRKLERKLVFDSDIPQQKDVVSKPNAPNDNCGDEILQISRNVSPSESDMITMTSRITMDQNDRLTHSLSNMSEPSLFMEAKNRMLERWHTTRTKEHVEKDDREVGLVDVKHVFASPAGLGIFRNGLLPSLNNKSYKMKVYHEDDADDMAVVYSESRNDIASKKLRYNQRGESSKPSDTVNNEFGNYLPEPHSRQLAKTSIENKSPVERQTPLYDTDNGVSNEAFSADAVTSCEIEVSSESVSMLNLKLSSCIVEDINFSEADEHRSKCSQVSGLASEYSGSIQQNDHSSQSSPTDVPPSEDVLSGPHCFVKLDPRLKELKRELHLFVLKLKSTSINLTFPPMVKQLRQPSSLAVSDSVSLETSFMTHILKTTENYDHDLDTFSSSWQTIHHPKDPRLFQHMAKVISDSVSLETSFMTHIQGTILSRSEEGLLYDYIEETFFRTSKSMVAYPWVNPGKRESQITLNKIKTEDQMLKVINEIEKEDAEEFIALSYEKDPEWLHQTNEIDILGELIAEVALNDLVLEDLVHLADHTPLGEKFTKFFDVVVQTTIWSIWRYRNNVIFSAKKPSKDLIFNDIKMYSFNWIVSRGRKVSLNRIMWFDHPCNALSPFCTVI
ncbi:zinc finger, CCHC-type containing protein [Tanacetum coccineum]